MIVGVVGSRHRGISRADCSPTKITTRDIYGCEALLLAKFGPRGKEIYAVVSVADDTSRGVSPRVSLATTMNEEEGEEER